MIQNYTATKLKHIVKNYDSKLWLTDMLNKSTLQTYRQHKNHIQEEQKLYDNSSASTILFWSRTGTLDLNYKNKKSNGQVNCTMCKENIEDTEHFILYCKSLNNTRRYIVGLQQPYKESTTETLADFLLFNTEDQDTIARNKNDLYKLWQHRSRILSLQKQDAKKQQNK